MKRVAIALTATSERNDIGRAVEDLWIDGLVEAVYSQWGDLVGIDWSVGAPELLRVPRRADRMCNMRDV